MKFGVLAIPVVGLILGGEIGRAQSSNDQGTATTATVNTSQGSASGEATASGTTQSVSSTAATISTSIQPTNARRFKGEILNWTTMTVSDAKNGDGSASAYNYVGLKYTISETQSVAIRQPFTVDHDFEKRDSSGSVVKESQTKAHVSDLYVNYAQKRIATFLDDGDVSGGFRVYAPTGEASRLKDTMGAFNLRAIVSKPLSPKVTLTYNFFPTWYNQTKDSYITASGTEAATANWGLFHYAGMDWQFSKYVSFSQALGTSDAWYRPLNGVAKQTHAAYIDSSLAISAIDNVDVSVGLSNEIDTHRPEKKFAPFRNDETTLYMVVSAVM